MRELHDGIALEDPEIMSGPFVWQNWDKWVARCEKIMKWFDRQSSECTDMSNTSNSSLSRPLPICGVEWEKFRAAVDKYREWLNVQCGGQGRIQHRLVFAHNDVSLVDQLEYAMQAANANNHRLSTVISCDMFPRETLPYFYLQTNTSSLS